MGIREIAQTRVRYGYRKTRVLLNREGWNVDICLANTLTQALRQGMALTVTPGKHALRQMFTFPALPKTTLSASMARSMFESLSWLRSRVARPESHFR